jgi:16S rRNA (cytidine1402-2'-O)-methyltransferase
LRLCGKGFLVGILYIVATPIGNLEDLSPRALRVLREVSLIAAEDTRHTAKLLTHFGLHTPRISYYEHNKLTKIDSILDQLTRGDVALVSDGGFPGISDPGYELIRAAIERGVAVSPIPGASALLSALVVSGLPTDSFVYLGFLPRKSSDRSRLLEDNKNDSRTLICFETPHRLIDSLEDMQKVFGDRQIAVCREMTKLYEEIFRGLISAAVTHFSQSQARGEFTLVIAGRSPEAQETWSEDRVRAALRKLIDDGVERKEAAKQVAAHSGWERRVVYKAASEL